MIVLVRQHSVEFDNLTFWFISHVSLPPPVLPRNNIIAGKSRQQCQLWPQRIVGVLISGSLSNQGFCAWGLYFNHLHGKPIVEDSVFRNENIEASVVVSFQFLLVFLTRLQNTLIAIDLFCFVWAVILSSVIPSCIAVFGKYSSSCTNWSAASVDSFYHGLDQDVGVADSVVVIHKA